MIQIFFKMSARKSCISSISYKIVFYNLFGRTLKTKIDSFSNPKTKINIGHNIDRVSYFIYSIIKVGNRVQFQIIYYGKTFVIRISKTQKIFDLFVFVLAKRTFSYLLFIALLILKLKFQTNKFEKLNKLGKFEFCPKPKKLS